MKKGFAAVPVIIMVFAVLEVGVMGYFAISSGKKSPVNSNQTTSINKKVINNTGITAEEFDQLGNLHFDCNNNNVDDDQDLQSGRSKDINKNGIPDECELTPALPRERTDNYSEVRLSTVDHTEPDNNATLSAWPKTVKVFFKEPPAGCRQMSVVTESAPAVPMANQAHSSADGLEMELSTDGADTSMGGPYIVRYSVCLQGGKVENLVSYNSAMESNGSFGFNVVFPK